MADPRVVNGFRPLTKEIIYQIVIERSRGCADVGPRRQRVRRRAQRLRHEPVRLAARLPARGGARGSSTWATRSARSTCWPARSRELVCELTGIERAAFCNTGSEAVMGAMRIARTVTGRSTIAIFTGAYHGIFDEVIVRGTQKLRSVPAAPGIMPASVAERAGARLRHAGVAGRSCASARDELAAVLVEPVQSRRPDFQPLRVPARAARAHREAGALLIFDEVVTGFRAHPAARRRCSASRPTSRPTARWSAAASRSA